MWECDVCEGEVESMGGLGNMVHGRCRQCGMSHSLDVSGNKQYTPEEQEQLQGLLQGACDAQDIYELDELEEYAEERRG